MRNHYIFELSNSADRKSITYENRYGLTIAGELYSPKNRKEGTTYQALIVGAPYGGVKEQGPGVYANQLAQLGFVVLTLDQSFMRYSQRTLVLL